MHLSLAKELLLFSPSRKKNGTMASADFPALNHTSLYGLSLPYIHGFIRSAYVLSVRQAGILPPASFRFHLVVDTLAIG